MGWYRRSKLAFDAFRNLTSKLIPKNPNQQSIQTITHHCNNLKPSSIVPKNRNVSDFSLPFRYGLMKQNQFSPFLNGAKRYYCVDRRQVSHFRPRGYKKWFQNVFIVVVVGSGVGITLYFGNLETIPYTKRTHCVLLSKRLEKQIGEWVFKQMKDSFKGKILPPIHPESVRVRLIARDIIEALQRGLKKEKQGWSDIGYASESYGSDQGSGDETLMALSEDPVTVEGLNWEVIVVNEPMVKAMGVPGGKIVVFSGLLEHFKSDSELATIIGHEVGHAVSRHIAEGITKKLWFAIVYLVLYRFFILVYTMSRLFLRLPFSRRNEVEADYIGLLLMASAGYDPRVAPKVYEKLGEVHRDSSLDDYLSTHPSGKKRAKLLAQAKVMEEALIMYREVHAGRGIEGFL